MKGRPSLFEVMNKAPETSGAVSDEPRRAWFRRRRDQDAGPIQIVAEALTEEQAAEELAALEAAAQEAVHERSIRDAERQARRESRRAERAAMRATAIEFVRSRINLGEAAPIVERAGDRVVVSVNLTSGLVAAAVLCVIFVCVYFAGRAAGANAGDTRLVEAAAITEHDAAKLDGRGTQMPAANRRSGRAPVRRDPDLSALAPSRTQPRSNGSVRANQPAIIAGLADRESGAEKLNYLEIQWFDFSGRQRDVVLEEVRKVRDFLAAGGVETVARQVSGGVRLYTRKGFSMSDEQRAERQAFQNKVSELGRSYRRQGGRYEWTDCFYVSYSRASSGEPI